MNRLEEKLSILANAAKYDVSCSSSGSNRKNEGGLGNSSSSGICHTYTEDGRCVSLLKILLTNHCIYDCAFCVSRKSNDIKRAAFTVEEVVEITMNFYRRNYIEGLFLSSGIFKNADFTMERMVKIAKKLRTEERFFGYIHLKSIPGASEDLIKEAGLYVDRMSINLELPTVIGLKMLAPEKDHESVKKPLAFTDQLIQEKRAEKKLFKKTPSFIPAGQSSQMVIGAAGESDLEILSAAHELYDQYHLKRVYYSGYIPISQENNLLPQIGTPPPLVRENRLYQTDWLIRFYGFKYDEIVNDAHPNLDLQIDPKLSWALRNPWFFPIDVQTAPLSELLRVPGLGRSSANKIISARKFGKLYGYQLKKMGLAFNRAKYFIRYADSPIELGYSKVENLHQLFTQKKQAPSALLQTAQAPQLLLF
jgi:putative DNA modification/repair radical SAM protein